MKFQVKIAVILLSVAAFIPPAFGQMQGLDYDIRGGKVVGFETDQENTTLKILLESRTRGEITITIPRSLIDSKANLEDMEFKIRVNGLSLNFYDETKTETERTVTIPFSRSDNEITITGTELFSQRATPQPQLQTIDNLIEEELRSETPPNQAKLLVFSDTQWSGALQSSSFDFTEIEGQHNDEVVFSCESSFVREGVFGVKIQKITQEGFLKLVVIQNQEIISESSTEEPFGDILINGNCVADFESNGTEGGGGCLIATAAFGSEMAPQVQQLRELRDNKILSTESGTQFMSLFNNFYYSFSPFVADYERENPTFKEMVKVTITPMIFTLSVLNSIEVNSEYDVLKYGISLIMLNIGIYIGIPAAVIIGIKKQL